VSRRQSAGSYVVSSQDVELLRITSRGGSREVVVCRISC
jgi:hypothetical protein